MSPLTEPTKLTLAKGFTWNETVWNPSMITTALWLDAADASTVTTVSGAVSQWNDKSGNARHATQATAANRPSLATSSLNSLNTIDFDGTNDFLATPVPSSISQEISFFIVFARDVNARVTQYLFNCVEYYANPTSSFPASFVVNGSASTLAANFDSGTNYTPDVSLSASLTSPAIIFASNKPSVGSLLYKNGTLEQSGAGVALSTGTQNWTVGRAALEYSGGVGDSAYDGKVAEIIFFTSTIATLNRQKLEGYLAHKWGLTANLPNDHPYKTVGPTP